MATKPTETTMNPLDKLKALKAEQAALIDAVRADVTAKKAAYEEAQAQLDELEGKKPKVQRASAEDIAAARQAVLDAIGERTSLDAIVTTTGIPKEDLNGHLAALKRAKSITNPSRGIYSRVVGIVA